LAAIKNASPVPKSHKPIIKIKIVEGLDFQ
jgi:hypothetical protein